MKTQSYSSFRRALLLSATTLAAFAVSLSLPIRDAVAATLLMKAKPTTANMNLMAKILRFAPKRVAPNTERLIRIAGMALSDNGLAERIFSNPDAVAVQYHLSKNELHVLQHMNRVQFETARKDAAQVVADRRAEAGSMRLPADAVDVRLITERMVVGRAILAAVGRSYLEAANAHQCCPWGHSIELGISSDPAFYNVVFQRPAGAALPAVQQRQGGSSIMQSPKQRMKVLGPSGTQPQ